MWFGMGLGWIVLIGAIVVLVQWMNGNRGERGHDSALEVLRRRYAAGEIDRAEYERLRRDLED